MGAIMQPIQVVFGTESGNAQGLAQRTVEELAKHGYASKAVDMLDVGASFLAQVDVLLVITSTYGNGDPPSNAEALHALLMKKSGPLPHVRFSVCSLGDTTYERFAQCGKDFDRRFEELGATRIAPRKDCDVDYDKPYEAWLAGVIAALASLPAAASEGPAPAAQPAAERSDALGTRRNPTYAAVLHNENLNGVGSTKETRRLVLAIDPAVVPYEPGDSIGVWPTNDPELVGEVLAVTKLDAASPVELDGSIRPLGELLGTALELQAPDARLADRVLGSHSADERSASLLAHHVIDLLRKDVRPWTAAELVRHLRPLAPRLYSIASSRLVHPREVHLLVDIVRYELSGHARTGVTSHHIAARAPVGTKLPIYLHKTPGFRLAAPDKDVIMIGPGTGVAPFRAFLEERGAQRATGRAWLFFGARNGATDFLYREELEAWRAAGVLTRLDTAFSRDQAEKIYVQHRLLEHAAELAAWISAGATVYVCGDAKHMAGDVQQALSEVLRRAGEADPAAKLAALAAEGRYQRDVY